MEGCGFRAALIVTLWVVLNTALNLFNKWALTPLQVELSWSSSLIRMSVAGRWAGAGFGFPLFYSMCHMIASFLGASLIFLVWPSTNTLQLKHLTSGRTCLQLSLLSLLFAANVAANNASLMTLGLAVNQLIKSVTPLLVMILMFALEGRTYSSPIVATVLLLTLGAAASIPWGTDAADNTGVGLASVSMVAASAKPALASYFAKDMWREGLTPLALVWYDSVFGALLTGVLCVASSERTELMGYFESKPGLGTFIVAFSSAMAFLYNLAVYSLASSAPPVVAVVASSLKQLALVVVAGIIIDRIENPLNWVGIVIFFLASFIYAYLALTESSRERSGSAGRGGRGGRGGKHRAEVNPAPAATTVQWSHKGIIASASTTDESTPLRTAEPVPPPGAKEQPWYARKKKPSASASTSSSQGAKEVSWYQGPSHRARQ